MPRYRRLPSVGAGALRQAKRIQDALDPDAVLAEDDPRRPQTRLVHMRSRCLTPDRETCSNVACPGLLRVPVAPS